MKAGKNAENQKTLRPEDVSRYKGLESLSPEEAADLLKELRGFALLLHEHLAETGEA